MYYNECFILNSESNYISNKYLFYKYILLQMKNIFHRYDKLNYNISMKNIYVNIRILLRFSK